MAKPPRSIALLDLAATVDVPRLRDLAKALAAQGTAVHIVCTSTAVRAIASRLFVWSADGACFEESGREPSATFTTHVFNLEAEAADSELAHATCVALTTRLCSELSIALLQCLRLVPDGLICAECEATSQTPFVFCIGSAGLDELERSTHARLLGAQALFACAGVVVSSKDAQFRLERLFPALMPLLRCLVIGMGVESRTAAVCRRSERGVALARAPALLTALLPSAAAAALSDPANVCILHSGPVEDGRGVEALIGAMPGVTAQRRNVHLIVVGEGSASGRMRELVDALASGLAASLHQVLGARGGGPWPELAAYADSEDAAPVLLSAPWLTEHVHFVPGQLDDDSAAALADLVDVVVFPPTVAALLQTLTTGAMPVVRAQPEWADIMSALVSVLERATVNRLRIPVHPSLCVLSLVEAIGYIAALGPAVLEETRPRVRATAVERHDWKGRSRELLAAYSQFAGR